MRTKLGQLAPLTPENRGTYPGGGRDPPLGEHASLCRAFSQSDFFLRGLGEPRVSQAVLQNPAPSGSSPTQGGIEHAQEPYETRAPNTGMPQGAVCNGPQPPPLQLASLPQPTLSTGLDLRHSGDKTATRRPIAGTRVAITSDYSGERPDQRGRNPARHSRRPPWQRSSTCTTPTSTSTSGCPEEHGAAAASAGHPCHRKPV
jgi:hypothetical protein